MRILALLCLAGALLALAPLASADHEHTHLEGRIEGGFLVEWCEYDLDPTDPTPFPYPRPLFYAYCQPQA